jgi:hypothetical protein
MRLVSALLLFVAALSGAGAAPAAVPTDVHQTRWFVHEDLITAGRPLSFYQALIAQASQDASELVQGGQGPADDPCCMGFSEVSVTTFGNTTFDLFEIDSQAELDELDGLPAGDATGPRMFVVNALNFCSGPGSPIGCADLPPCGSEPSDLVMLISMEAYDLFDVFAKVLAHEEGHNACLVHVTGNSCELMAASGGGGCLSSAECAEFTEDAQATAGSCSCYAGTSAYEPDGTACSEAPSGVCSGGVCGGPTSDAAAALFAAAGAGALSADPPDDPLRMSGAGGDWLDLGTFSGGQQITGLAYSPGRDTIYGVGPGAVADQDLLFTVDPSDGSTTLVGAVTGLVADTDLVSLAWNPGASSGTADDRLFAVDLESGGVFGFLYEIDPDTAVATNLSLGGIDIGGTDGFSGLAYDPVSATLFASASFGSGLYVLNLPCGNPFCTTTEIIDPALLAPVNKFESALAWSAAGRIHHIGRQSGPRILYDSYDASLLAGGTVSKVFTRGLDGFTAGGLASSPNTPIVTTTVPALSVPAVAAVVLGVAFVLARRRH